MSTHPNKKQKTKTGKEVALEYENYDETSRVYDKTRVACGVDRLKKLFKASDRVLDGGAGTGNYLVELAPCVREIVGFEFNAGMRSQLTAKVKSRGLTNAKIMAGSLLEPLPFEDNSFDGVIVNQVLHHLDAGGVDATYPNITKVLAEFARILKPGGRLSINNTTAEQCNGLWWYNMFPEEVKKQYELRHMSKVKTIEMMTAAGFDVEAHSETRPLMGSNYFHLGGPLIKDWRDSDSTWSLLSDQQLASIEANWRKRTTLGTAGQEFDKLDAPRRDHGQSTFFIGTRK